MAQVLEPFRAIVLDGEVGERSARHQGQGDGDLRDARLVQGVLDQFADQTALAVFFGLLAQARTINVEPLLAHGIAPFQGSVSPWVKVTTNSLSLTSTSPV